MCVCVKYLLFDRFIGDSSTPTLPSHIIGSTSSSVLSTMKHQSISSIEQLWLRFVSCVRVSLYLLVGGHR